MACCFYSWFPVCCWNKAPYPTEKKLMVTPPGQAVFAATVVGQVVRGEPEGGVAVGQAHAAGQPVEGRPVEGRPVAPPAAVQPKA